jgi:putative spermidine/putrescine transport system substrate-binding protein
MSQGSDHKVTRRALLRKAGTAGAVIGLGALGGASPWTAVRALANHPKRIDITEFIWIGGGQGIVPREVKRAYEKLHPNVHVELFEGTNATTYPRMVAQREVNPNKPLVNFGFFNVDAHTKGMLDDMWLPLDPAKIPNMNNVFDSYRVKENKGIGWGLSSISVLHNRNLVKEPPASWNDIFAPRFKGKVMIFDYAFGFNGLLGVAYANGGSEKNIDVAFEKYSKAAQDGQFLAMFTTNQQVKEALARGEALVAPYFTSFAITWNEEAPSGEGPFGYTVPRENMIAFTYYFQIVKGTAPEQIDVASDIINMYLWKDTIARYCNFTATVPAVKGTILKPQYKDEPAFRPAAIENAIQPDWAYVAEKTPEWRQRWDREVKAKMR